MTRVLIVGATGFVGSYLMDAMVARGTEVVGTSFLPTVEAKDYAWHAGRLRRCDIRYREQVDAVINDVRPDLVYHLAAQSYPALSWTAPSETLETNVVGTANVFDSIKQARLDAKVVVACSSAQYGDVAQDQIPVKETHPMRPLHPYGVSKVATELLAMQYCRNFGLRTVCARIFNTTGPRKKGDVCADLTERAVSIERGELPPVLRAGNLETFRAITDVRDLIVALELLAEQGQSGEVYNVSGAKLYQVRQLVELIQKNVRIPLEVEIDTSLLRPTDEKVIFGDSSRLVAATGWQQQHDIEQTLRDMLDYWRAFPAGAVQ